MSEAWRVSFDPLIGWPWLMAAAVLAALGWAAYLGFRGRAPLSRGLGLALLLAALSNPAIVEEEREPLTSVAAIVVDRSESMGFGDRQALADTAVAALRERLGSEASIELRVVESETGADSTRLISALEAVLADVPRDRIAGAILVTDGQVHDIPEVPESLSALGPVHALVVGDPEAGDRRISITQGPGFGIVGEQAGFTVRVDDPASPQAPVIVSLNGEVVERLNLPTGRDVPLPVTIERRGNNVLVVETPAGPQELTLANNRTAASVSGVRDRLRVVLITGQPHAGARVWRDLLKSDPQVDLVHFIILRPPTKTDMTPESELALIQFPAEQLFEESLPSFDLIIFDQYERRGLIQLTHLAAMARYVEEGGALFVVAGPTFAGPGSLARTPLASVLPVAPTGRVFEEGTRAQVSAIGQRHTVTAGLPDAGQWGPWYRYTEGRVTAGNALLQAPNGDPLLVLNRVGKGRVGQIMTDQMWLWARGHEGGGPFSEVMRRSVHWLMGEPELDEQRLDIVIRDGKVSLSLFILDTVPPALTVETPSGEVVRPTWKADAQGIFRAEFPDAGLGLYRARAGDIETVALNGPANPKEYADLSVSTLPLTPLAEATQGGVIAMADAADMPQVRLVGETARAAGNDWLGLRERGAYAVTASRSLPLFPGLLGMLGVLGLLMWAWRREGR